MMKFVICCILSVCAFKAVFADKLEDDINKTYKTYVEQLNKTRNSLERTIKTEMQAANKKGINTGGDDGCLGSSTYSIKTYVDARFQKLKKCRTDAIKNKNKESAENCSQKVVDGFNAEAKIAHDSANGCIQKCSKINCSET